METPELASAEYWESEEIDIRLNPKRTIEADGLSGFLTDELGLRSVVVMATSGSTGEPKFVLLKKSALLASAKAVVEHCSIRKEDVWLAGLSDFHVGGLGIFARAYVSGSRVATLPNTGWLKDGRPFADAIDGAGATLTSLTPTHLHDLVTSGVVSPDSLRGVLLGGGRIEAGLVEKATELGWRIWPSYGMTEACSQIATSLDGKVDWLPILPHWDYRLSENGRLQVRGEALFFGYVVRKKGKWTFDPGKTDGGWFETGDCCEIGNGQLRFLHRADDLVKISGELISVSAVESVAASVCRMAGSEAVVLALPCSRREHELVAFVTKPKSTIMADINRRLDRIEQVSRIVPVKSFPRTEIGKIDRRALRSLAGGE